MGNSNSIEYHDDYCSYYGKVKYKKDIGWIANGNGRLDWASDIKNNLLEKKIYIGKFKNNEANGYGICTYIDGAIYEGEWKNNLRHGKGKMIYIDGTIYEGNFEYDIQNGKGQYILPSLYYYIGNIKGGKIYGKGKYYDPNKKLIYDGEWINFNYNGYGISYFINGQIEYKGYWKDSNPHGKGILYNLQGNILKNGIFINGTSYNNDKADIIIPPPLCWTSISDIKSNVQRSVISINNPVHNFKQNNEPTVKKNEISLKNDQVTIIDWAKNTNINKKILNPLRLVKNTSEYSINNFNTVQPPNYNIY